MSEAGRPDPSSPQRLCVGCRGRAPVADLLRVVAVEGRVVPDPRRRLPGRGAHVHPALGCLQLAERRRAFPRALRLDGPLDTSALHEHLARLGSQDQTANNAQAGHDGDERSMSTNPR